jgi:hypothetical protein
MMKAKLIKTDGPWLKAEIEVGLEKLFVMDEFSSDERSAPSLGAEMHIELSAMVDEGESWESIFAANPTKKKGLEHLEGWSYRAFGEVTSIHPVNVDCGLVQVPDVIQTNDPRVIGEFVGFTITRLQAM